jgi:hypothetical protein
MLSIVVAARNDDHGGACLGRVNLSLGILGAPQTNYAVQNAALSGRK